MAQLVGHHPANQRVVGWIPSQGTFLGCGFGPGRGAYKRQLVNVSPSHQCFSPSLSPSLFLSLKSMGMSLGKDLKKEETHVLLKKMSPDFAKRLLGDNILPHLENW